MDHTGDARHMFDPADGRAVVEAERKRLQVSVIPPRGGSMCRAAVPGPGRSFSLPPRQQASHATRIAARNSPAITGSSGEAVQQGTDRHARDRCAQRRGADRVFQSGAVHAEVRGNGGGPRAGRDALPRGHEAKLKGLRTDAGAALAVAEKVLAAAKTDQTDGCPSVSVIRARTRAEELKQKAAAMVAELESPLDTVEANAKSKLDGRRRPKTPLRQPRAIRAAAPRPKMNHGPPCAFLEASQRIVFCYEGWETCPEEPANERCGCSAQETTAGDQERSYPRVGPACAGVLVVAGIACLA
jgi:hypothetical protein